MTNRRLDLAKQADAILRRAHCDTVTSAKMDRQYRRDKNAKRKRFAGHWRAKQKHSPLGAGGVLPRLLFHPPMSSRLSVLTGDAGPKVPSCFCLARGWLS